MTHDYMQLAAEAIDNRATVAYDVAAGDGQIFDNVSHMKWFYAAVADAIREQVEAGEDAAVLVAESEVK